MTFWDSVKNVAGEAADALSNAATDVTNSAKDYNEKSKLKKAINAEEAKINSAYRQMGEKLYSSNSIAPAGYNEFYSIIDNSKAEIERLQAELQNYEKK